MGVTHLSGLHVGGVPVLPGIGGLGITAFRNVYFVDNRAGSDAETGLGIDVPFKTVQKALDTVVDEDTIVVMKGIGNYDEKLATGQNIRYAAMEPGRGRNVTLAGACPTYQPYNSPQLYNVDSDEYSLFLRSPGWRITGFRIVGDSGAPICVKAVMAQAANTADTDYSPGFQIDNCSIYGAVGSCTGLQITANADSNVYNTVFDQFGTESLPAVSDGGGGFTFPQVDFRHCTFKDNSASIDLPLQASVILACVVGLSKINTITRGIDLRGSGGANGIHGCYLDGVFKTFTNSGVYEGVASDDWAGNFCSDLSGASVDNSTGITKILPAA